MKPLKLEKLSTLPKDNESTLKTTERKDYIRVDIHAGKHLPDCSSISKIFLMLYNEDNELVGETEGVQADLESSMYDPVYDYSFFIEPEDVEEN